MDGERVLRRRGHEDALYHRVAGAICAADERERAVRKNVLDLGCRLKMKISPWAIILMFLGMWIAFVAFHQKTVIEVKGEEISAIRFEGMFSKTKTVKKFTSSEIQSIIVERRVHGRHGGGFSHYIVCTLKNKDPVDVTDFVFREPAQAFKDLLEEGISRRSFSASRYTYIHWLLTSAGIFLAAAIEMYRARAYEKWLKRNFGHIP